MPPQRIIIAVLLILFALLTVVAFWAVLRYINPSIQTQSNQTIASFGPTLRSISQDSADTTQNVELSTMGGRHSASDLASEV
jgi:hypothetical protein